MLTRRAFIGGSLATIAACRKGPAIVSKRPSITHGVQSGDVQTRRAIVWARCDEPARMLVEWRAAPSAAWQRVAGPLVNAASDLAGHTVLDALPDGQTIEYRIAFDREAARGISDWSAGRFITPGAGACRVAWTGDTCGQGFGRNPDWGGLRGYAAMRDKQPAVFIHSGDMIYADNPIVPEHKTLDGKLWRNVSNERVAKVAETLDEFRARFAYNLEDEHLRAFAAEVPVIASWDDHETHNNWWPGQQLADDRYQERNASTLASHARRAFSEWNPVEPRFMHRVLRYGPLLDVLVLDARSFRTANARGDDDSAAMLGREQLDWLLNRLMSPARWKLIACDQPLALVIPDDDRQEGFANGVPGAAIGRERELVKLLLAMKTRNVKNVVWITADVHYAAAHYFDPLRANVGFDPFWEFVAGPIHAGTFGPNDLDPTLGPELKFQWAPPPGTGNLAPWDGLQSFGTIDVTRDSLSVALWGIDGRERYRVELPYQA